MGFFSRLFGTPASQTEFECSAQPKTCIFDVAGLTESATRNGAAASPRENFDALKTLAQFAAQEGLNLIAVFTGRPLREASDGATFKNVKVHYAENTAACRKTVMRLAQDGHGALVITADTELERLAAAQGTDCMRSNTFKKALDNRDNRDGRDHRERRQSRPPRRNGNNNNNNNAVEEDRKEAADGEAPESPSSRRSGPDQDDSKKEILDLIDPI